MSTDLRIYRKGFQTWNDDFLQWLATFNFTSGGFITAEILNTTYFTGTVLFGTMAEGYYRLFLTITNILEIDTSTDNTLSFDICDVSSILGVNTIEDFSHTATVIDGSADSGDYSGRIPTIQFVSDTSILYLSTGLTIPVNQTWSIDIDLLPTTLVSKPLLKNRTIRRLKDLQKKYSDKMTLEKIKRKEVK